MGWETGSATIFLLFGLLVAMTFFVLWSQLIRKHMRCLSQCTATKLVDNLWTETTRIFYDVMSRYIVVADDSVETVNKMLSV
jgi:hypothetical protein